MAKKENSTDEIIRKRRRQRRQIIGAFVCLLAVIGIVTVVRLAVVATQNLFDDSAERAEYENRLTYVVMLDMLPFSSLEQANQSDLLESCIWAALFNEDSTLYARDETGALLLPSTDVDRYAAKLFGPDYKLTHGTFESEGMTFFFDEESQCYTIPVTGQVSNYTPKVVEISGSHTVKRVSVGYLEPYASATDFSTNRDTSEPVKYYDYIFSRSGDGNYYLTSMEESAWVSNVTVTTTPEMTDSAPAAVTDPNVAVDDATNASVDSAISQEINAAQSDVDSAASDSTDSGTDSTQSEAESESESESDSE